MRSAAKVALRVFWTTFTLSVCLDSAKAEGTAELNVTQALRGGTQLYVDIIDSSVERIVWTGAGQVAVTAPDGTAIGLYGSGATIPTDHGNGAYGLRVESWQFVGRIWDVTVLNPTASGGRLFSYDWAFNAGAFSSDRATQGSFYAILPGGAQGTDAVIELKLDGLAGFVYNINANRTGVFGPNAGRSVSAYGHYVVPEFPIYLNPPTIANYNPATPDIYGLDFVGGVSQDVLGNSIPPCQQIAPGLSYGVFQFDTNAEGTYHLQCDLDRDGLFEATNNDDLLVVGTTVAGFNSFWWDGLHQGSPVAAGSYQCRVRVNVGEFHYVGTDIETSYQGMRMFEVRADGSRRGLAMHWNDSAVQSNANTMGNGEIGLVSAGEDGMDSGDYATPAQANRNARAWGNFTSSGKGNQSLLDTYVWLASDASTVIQLTAVDPTVDTDGDGLSDFEERCAIGSNPNSGDTDGDGVEDGVEYGSSSSSSGVGGLEANGRLASRVARRSILRSRFSPQYALRGEGRLAPFLESLTLPGWQRLEATPTDLLSLTNATDVLGYDYFHGRERVGSILMLETHGATYEHSKGICDRAGGSDLLSVKPLFYRGYTIIASHLRKSATLDATTDHALSFKLYETEDHRFDVMSHWLRSSYEPVREGQRVLNVQIWAKNAGDAWRLTTRFLDRLAIFQLLVPATPTLLDEETRNQWAPSLPKLATTPPVIVSRGALLGRKLSLDVTRIGPIEGDKAALRLTSMAVQGGQLSTEYIPLELRHHKSIELSRPLVRDVTVDLMVNDQVVDQLWLSDGWWAQFDDSLWGGHSVVRLFTTEDCSLADFNLADEAVVEFSGCARVESDDVDDYVGVARHIFRPISLLGVSSINVRYQSAGPVTACLEDTSTGDRSCIELPAAATGRRVAIDASALAPSTERADLVTFTVAPPNNGASAELEVAGLSFGANTATLFAETDAPHASSGVGCRTDGADDPYFLWPMLLAILLLAIRRR